MNISLSEWEKKYSLSPEEDALLSSIVSTQETDPEPQKSLRGPQKEKTDHTIHVRLPKALISGLGRSETALEELSLLRKMESESRESVGEMESMIMMKNSVVESIDKMYSESSSLLAKHKLLVLLSHEVEGVYKYCLTEEKIFYYNSLVRRFNAEENSDEQTLESVVELVRYSAEGELFFQMNQHLVESTYQHGQWKKIRDILADTVIRKCAQQIRHVYSRILPPREDGLVGLETKLVLRAGKEYLVNTAKLLRVARFNPVMMLALQEVTFENGGSLATEEEGLQEATSEVESNTKYIVSLLRHIRQHNSSIHSNIKYGEMIQFILNNKKNTNSSWLEPVYRRMTISHRNKEIGTEEFLDRCLSFTLLHIYCDYSDYTRTIYSNDPTRMRYDESYRQYLQEVCDSVSSLVFPVLTQEKNSDSIYRIHDILSVYITLPIQVSLEGVEVQPHSRQALDLLVMMEGLERGENDVLGLFKGEVFCYFYSLFKMFVEAVVKIYKIHVHTISHQIYSHNILKYGNGAGKEVFLHSHKNLLQNIVESELAITEVKKSPGKSSKTQEPQNIDEKSAIESAKESLLEKTIPVEPSPNLKDLYFRPIVVCTYICKNTHKRIPPSQHSSLSYDSISSTIKLLLDTSNTLDNLTYRHMFILKNMLYLYTSLFNNDVSLTYTTLTYDAHQYNIDIDANVLRLIDYIVNLAVQTSADPLALFLDSPAPNTATLAEVSQAVDIKIKTTIEDIVCRLAYYGDQRCEAVYKNHVVYRFIDRACDKLYRYKVESSRLITGSDVYKGTIFEDVNNYKIDLYEYIDRLLVYLSSTRPSKDCPGGSNSSSKPLLLSFPRLVLLPFLVVLH